MVDMTGRFGSDRGREKRALLARQKATFAPPDASSAQGSAPSTEQRKDADASPEPDVFESSTKHLKDPEFIPLVHLWLDLSVNLNQESMGDPVDLYRERFAITSNPELPSLREHIALHHGPSIGDSDSDSHTSGTDSEYAPSAGEREPRVDDVGKPKRFQRAEPLRHCARAFA